MEGITICFTLFDKEKKKNLYINRPKICIVSTGGHDVTMYHPATNTVILDQVFVCVIVIAKVKLDYYWCFVLLRRSISVPIPEKSHHCSKRHENQRTVVASRSSYLISVGTPFCYEEYFNVRI